MNTAGWRWSCPVIPHPHPERSLLHKLFDDYCQRTRPKRQLFWILNECLYCYSLRAGQVKFQVTGVICRYAGSNDFNVLFPVSSSGFNATRTESSLQNLSRISMPERREFGILRLLFSIVCLPSSGEKSQSCHSPPAASASPSESNSARADGRQTGQCW